MMSSLLHEAAVDFDVVAHIGYVKNIDLSHKVQIVIDTFAQLYIYYIRVFD